MIHTLIHIKLEFLNLEEFERETKLRKMFYFPSLVVVVNKK